MRQALSFILVTSLVCVGAVAGCAKKAASGQEAIQTSQAMETAQKKVDYLIGQAKAFYNSKEYKDASAVATHVLTNLDKDSQAAKKILEDARAQLEVTAKAAVQDLKQKFGIGGK